MPYLSQTQLQRMNAGAYSRDGAAVPATNQPPLLNAACWAWALAGESINSADEFSAASVYEKSFNFDTQRRPTGIDSGYLNQLTSIWPDSGQAVSELESYFADAQEGATDAQGRCRMALMKIAAITNGLTVNGEGADHDYTVHMKSSSWYGWDHWGIGVRMPDTTINYVQTVPDTPIQYRCRVIWDEPLADTIIGVDGLLPAHIDVLNKIP